MEKNHHHHHHSHDESASRIGMAFILNVGFTFIEFIGGWLTNSTAIMAVPTSAPRMTASADGKVIRP